MYFPQPRIPITRLHYHSGISNTTVKICDRSEGLIRSKHIINLRDDLISSSKTAVDQTLSTVTSLYPFQRLVPISTDQRIYP